MLTLKGRTMIITGGAGHNGMKIVEMALEGGMNVALMSGFHAKAQEPYCIMRPINSLMSSGEIVLLYWAG